VQKQNWASTRPPHSKPHKPLPPPSHTLPITLPHPLQHLPTSKHPILPPLLTPSHPTLNRGTPHPHPHHPQVTPHLTDGLSSTASLIKRNALPALLPCSTPQPATLTVCLLHPGPQPLAHPNQPPLITSTHTHTHHQTSSFQCGLALLPAPVASFHAASVQTLSDEIGLVPSPPAQSTTCSPIMHAPRVLICKLAMSENL